MWLEWVQGDQPALHTLAQDQNEPPSIAARKTSGFQYSR
jgi:hypothetical protein